MKQRIKLLGIILLMALSLPACGQKPESEPDPKPIEEPKSEPEPEPEEEKDPEGMYRSELTNEWIDEALKDQRPIAAMIDNESVALPHYGLTKADIVYEIMNSKMNGRITRFMVLVKNWDSTERLGNIRSARTTNVILASEWNAVLCHDGGPYYINSYLKEKCADNISGEFGRIPNGKSREYTEYISAGEVKSLLEKHKISATYNDYYEGTHFQFATEKEPVELAGAEALTANAIELPFPHNMSSLEYRSADQLYYYSEYEAPHVDPGNNNAQLCFKNLILQKCSYKLLDENGYLTYDCIGSGEGYFVTNGKAVPITWKKDAMASPTHFYDAAGNAITLNTGKTYIALIPADKWDELVMN